MEAARLKRETGAKPRGTDQPEVVSKHAERQEGGRAAKRDGEERDCAEKKGRDRRTLWSLGVSVLGVNTN